MAKCSAAGKHTNFLEHLEGLKGEGKEREGGTESEESESLEGEVEECEGGTKNEESEGLEGEGKECQGGAESNESQGLDCGMAGGDSGMNCEGGERGEAKAINVACGVGRGGSGGQLDGNASQAEVSMATCLTVDCDMIGMGGMEMAWAAVEVTSRVALHAFGCGAASPFVGDDFGLAWMEWAMADRHGFQIPAALHEYEAGESYLPREADLLNGTCDDEPCQIMPTLRSVARRSRSSAATRPPEVTGRAGGSLKEASSARPRFLDWRRRASAARKFESFNKPSVNISTSCNMSSRCLTYSRAPGGMGLRGFDARPGLRGATGQDMIHGHLSASVSVPVFASGWRGSPGAVGDAILQNPPSWGGSLGPGSSAGAGGSAGSRGATAHIPNKHSKYDHLSPLRQTGRRIETSELFKHY